VIAIDRKIRYQYNGGHGGTKTGQVQLRTKKGRLQWIWPQTEKSFFLMGGSKKNQNKVDRIYFESPRTSVPNANILESIISQNVTIH